MRSWILMMALAVPAFCGDGSGVWYLDVHRVAPTLEGHYKGTQDGDAVDFDLKRDLGLAKDGAKVGVGLEYQGRRFGLELSMETQDYLGSNVVDRDVTISGETWKAQALLTTRIKMTNYTGNWTIRFLRTPGFWFGLDLGVRGTVLDLHATGSNYLTDIPLTASFKSGLPMPQIGPSAGYTAFEGRLAVRGYYHYLGYKGATYRNAGGDIRFFPVKWLGLRAFGSQESWKVPNNSISNDLEIGLDRSGTGFGVVVKF